MKYVSIKMQRIIMWIPYANIANLFIWFFINRRFYSKVDTFPKTRQILLSTSLPLMVLQVLIFNYFPAAGQILAILNAYIIPLCMGYRFIKYQLELSEDQFEH